MFVRIARLVIVLACLGSLAVSIIIGSNGSTVLAWSQAHQSVNVTRSSNRLLAQLRAKETQQRIDVVGLSAIGIHYSAATTGPAITHDQALQTAAIVWGPDLVAQATSLSVHYVLYTDDLLFSRDGHGNRIIADRNIPAWIVSVQGVNLASHGRSGDPITYNHEANIVIDARDGRYLGMFAYR